MDYQMTKHGKLVVTIDVSKTAWEQAKTSAKGNKVLTSGGFTSREREALDQRDASCLRHSRTRRAQMPSWFGSTGARGKPSLLFSFGGEAWTETR